MVSDIRNHGLFVELRESMAYGLVPVSSWTDDLYAFDAERGELVGRRSGKRFQVGQMLWVSVERVDRFKRQIDFRLVEAPGSSKTSPTTARKGRPLQKRESRRSKG
jgi:exoribonuclease R